MAVMPPIAENPTLDDLQQWVRDMKAANDWTPTDFRHEAFLLMEEVGELCKAFRKTQTTSYLTASQRGQSDDLAEEMADVLVYLASLANLSNINLASALRAKMDKNRAREWKTQEASA